MSTRYLFWSPNMPELSSSPSGTVFSGAHSDNLWRCLRPFIAGVKWVTSRPGREEQDGKEGWDGRKWRERMKGREGR